MTVEITEQELANARQIWGNALIAISTAFEEKGIDGARVVANGALDTAYGYELGPVLFKPTLAKEKQFRSTKDEFISYFLGQNKVCKEDKGFAIKNWQSIKFENFKVVNYNDQLLSMGNYYFEDDKNELLKVEYTFGFIKVSPDQLRINLHHSSLPYND
mgnify:CR=1 FL=1